MQYTGRSAAFFAALNISKDIGGCTISGQRCWKFGGFGHSRMMAAAAPQHMQRIFIRSRVSFVWLMFLNRTALPDALGGNWFAPYCNHVVSFRLAIGGPCVHQFAALLTQSGRRRLRIAAVQLDL